MIFVSKTKSVKIGIVAVVIIVLLYILSSTTHRRKGEVRLASSLALESNEKLPLGVILESRGPFGDQLFKYSVSFALAKSLKIPLYVIDDNKHSEDVEYEIPVNFKNSVEYKSVLQVFHLPLASWVTPDSLNITVQDTWQIGCSDVFATEEIKTHLSSEFISISQVCESEIYFESVVSEIKDSLAPRLPWGSKAFISWKENIDEVNTYTIRNKVFGLRTSVAVIINTSYRTLPISYYRRGMHLLEEKFKDSREVVFFVFSDDMEYVKANLVPPLGEDSNGPKELGFKPGNVFLVSGSDLEEQTTFLEEFVLTLLCKNIIISDDSASWWAAYLLIDNSNKTVIAPKRMYSSNSNEQIDVLNVKLEIKPTYPKGWIELDLIEE